MKRLGTGTGTGQRTIYVRRYAGPVDRDGTSKVGTCSGRGGNVGSFCIWFCGCGQQQFSGFWNEMTCYGGVVDVTFVTT